MAQLSLRKMYSQIDEVLNIQSDDSVFDYRFYYDLICQNREVDIRNEYNRNRTFSEGVFQTLSCLDLEIVDASTCCGEVITGCKLLRSVNKLPKTIEFHQKDSIQSIRPNSVLAKPIILINSERIPHLTETVVTKNNIYGFIYNNYLYLYSFKSDYLLIESVTIRGIFYDPMEAALAGCHQNQTCFDSDSEFPINGWMWQSLTKPKVLAEVMGKQYMPKDEQNNAKDDKTEINGKQSK